MLYIPVDIETIPEQPEGPAREKIAAAIKPPASMSKPETIQEWEEGKGKYAGAREAAIDAEYLTGSFDGARGQICSISWADGIFGDVQNIVAIPGKTSEAALLAEFFRRTAAIANGRFPVFAGHFISGFDLRYIYQRAIVNQVRPPFAIRHDGRHGIEYFDTMKAWCGYRDSISLDALCAGLGIEVPSPEGMEGATVYKAYKEGRFDDIAAYNNSDVIKVQRIMQAMFYQTEVHEGAAVNDQPRIQEEDGQPRIPDDVQTC